MHRGYTHRWRKRWDKFCSEYNCDPWEWILFDYILDHITHKDFLYKSELHQVAIPLRRGEGFFMISEMARKFKVSRDIIRIRLKRMADREQLKMTLIGPTGKPTGKLTGKLTGKVHRSGYVIKVINLDRYQPEPSGRPQGEPTGKSTGELTEDPTTEQKDNNNKNIKKSLCASGKPDKPPKPPQEKWTYPDWFEDFWKTYPNVRRVKKKKCYTKLCGKLNNGANIDDVMTGLRWWLTSDWWTKRDGEYVHMPETWINGDMWNDRPAKAKGEQAKKWWQTIDAPPDQPA